MSSSAERSNPTENPAPPLWEPSFPERTLALGWFDWLVRHRLKLYGILAVLYLASFNGFWRVGVDSALYRGLARSLNNGQGYVFAGEHHRHAYPGLPWMLAILDRIFGESPVPGLIVMTVMAIATLWLVDRLIALRYPLWMAVVVTIGMALNVRFVRQSQQLMTDVPFTLGVVGSLYALERLRLLAKNASAIEPVKWAIALLVGLALAAMMRPTFGVLAGALVVGSAVRAFTCKERRWLHVGIVVAALAVMFVLFLVDPRTAGISPMQGVYEQELIDRVQELPSTVRGQLQALLGRDLNDAFFSQRLSPVNYLASAFVLFASALVLRRNLVWGLLIFGLIAITLPLSTVPRYYLMVMPFLWVGWILAWCHITLKLPNHLKGPVLGLALGFPMMVNGARSVGFLMEQRAPDVAWLLHGKDRTQTFYTAYRDGIVFKQQAIAKMIAEHSTPLQKTVGPDAHVLAYYADRRVIGERTLFIDREMSLAKLPSLLAKATPDLAILPVSLYSDSDSLMREMIRRRILIATRVVAQIDGAQLVAAAVRVPAPGVDWKKMPPPELNATHRPTTQRLDLVKRRQILAERALKTKRDEHAERQAKVQKRQKAEKQQKIDRADKRKRAEIRDQSQHSRHHGAASAPSATTQPS